MAAERPSVRFYTPWDVFGIVLYNAASAAAVAAAFLIADKGFTALAASYTAFTTYRSLAERRELLDNDLVRHPDTHAFSPNLGKIVGELYGTSGLSAQDCPVYDFRVNPKAPATGKKLRRLFRQSYNFMARTHNAAAAHMGKPFIMISEPLLRLLDDTEEKAILAHEFAHAASRHSYVHLPQQIATQLARNMCMCVMYFAMWQAGFMAIVLAFGAYYAWTALVGLVHPDGKLMQLKETAETSAQDLRRKDRVKRIGTVIGSFLMTAIFTAFNHHYLFLWLATSAICICSSYLQAALGRNLEYLADRGAVALGADPLALITALRKIRILEERGKKKVFSGQVPRGAPLVRLWQRTFGTHPSLRGRVKQLVGIAKKRGVPESRIYEAVKGQLAFAPEDEIPYDIVKQIARRI